VQEEILNYQFNAQLLQNMQDNLSIRNKDMADALGIAPAKMCRYKKCGDLPIGQLIDVCNIYGIRPSEFIICNNHSGKSLPKTGVKYQWIYRSKIIEKRLTREISKTKAQRLLKCGWYNPTEWVQCDAPVSKLLKVCNTFRWNLGDFINDRTLPKISPWENQTEMLLEIFRLKKFINDSEIMETSPYMDAAEDEG